MARRKARPGAAGQRALIQELNERYRREFVRAEQLEALLAPVKALGLLWALRGLRRLHRWLTRARPGGDDVSLPLPPVPDEGLPPWEGAEDAPPLRRGCSRPPSTRP